MADRNISTRIESITITENLAAFVNPLIVYVLDTVSISEFNGLLDFPLNINVHDSVSVAELDLTVLGQQIEPNVIHEKQLGQLRPSVTSPVRVYNPQQSMTAICKNVTVCNTTASKAKFSIYHCNNGVTFDQSTALFYQVDIEANQTVVLPAFMAFDNYNSNMAVQTDTANALTFSLYGAELT